MAFLEIGIASFFGTLVMTLFSYFMSDLLSEEFGEPILLRKLIENVNNSKVSPIIGWLLHWVIGVFFSIISYMVFNSVVTIPIWAASVLTGAIFGIIGIFGWIIMLKLHPCPPKINASLFYKQLFIAHILFALSVFLSYCIF